jgi:hypothetical protein
VRLQLPGERAQRRIAALVRQLAELRSEHAARIAQAHELRRQPALPLHGLRHAVRGRSTHPREPPQHFEALPKHPDLIVQVVDLGAERHALVDEELVVGNGRRVDVVGNVREISQFVAALPSSDKSTGICT